MHLTSGIKDFQILEDAIERAKHEAKTLSEQKALKAGATKSDTSLFEKIETAELRAGKSLFIEAVITAKTTGNIIQNPKV